MGLHVADVVRSVTELSTTLCTLCNLLPSVETTVYLKAISSSKLLPTDITFESHSRMHTPDVFGEIALIREALIAVTTGVRPLARVCPHVLGEV